ncbi:hypothetical protein ScPMuIL_007143 [Solemya velum]
MTLQEKFVEAFWDADDLGVRGFDIVCARMKAGTKLCKNIEDVMKQRAKSEAEYGRAMLNLARKMECCEDTGVLGASWRLLMVQTEKMYQIFERASAASLNLAKTVKRFNEEQKKKKTQIEERIRKLHHARQQLHHKTADLHKSHYQRCEERDTIGVQLKAARKSVTVPTRDIEKIQQKFNAVKETCNLTGQAYKNSVEMLENLRQSWEKETETALETFQTLDETRIDFLRHELWTSINIVSETCVDQDECCEQVRLTLEKCDPKDDIQEFIRKNKTGAIRPAPVRYQPYDDDKAHYEVLSATTTLPHRVNTISTRAPAPLPPNVSPIIIPSRPAPPSTSATYVGNDVAVTQSQRNQIQATKSYTAENPNELTVQRGEMYDFVRQMDKNDMWQVKKRGSNVYGLVPKECFGSVMTYL